MSEMAKLSHKKSPRSKAQFKKMGQLGAKKRWAKLSTGEEHK